MTDAEGFLIELALHLNFKMVDDDGEVFECTQDQLLEFAKRIQTACRQKADDDLAVVKTELAVVRSVLDTPMLQPFAEAVVNEARHQILRYPADHDANKTAWDWFWTLGYLSQKAAHAQLTGDMAKALHHTVSSAALLANWHRHLTFMTDYGKSIEDCRERFADIGQFKGAPKLPAAIWGPIYEKREQTADGSNYAYFAQRGGIEYGLAPWGNRIPTDAEFEVWSAGEAAA